MMLLSAADLQHYAVRGTDGNIGKVREFYFDDQSCTIRYLVADTGGWLTGRLVLLAPDAITQVDQESKVIEVSLSQQQVENSPSIYEHQPVSRQYETRYYDYYGWPYYWAQGFPVGVPGVHPASAVQDAVRPDAESVEGVTQEDPADPHLQSTRDVTGCGIQARNGHIGHVDDFILDDQAWQIRYIVADTRDWLPGKKVLIAPEWIRDVAWEESKVYVDLAREKIKDAPEYDPHEAIDKEYEERLHNYYERLRPRG